MSERARLCAVDDLKPGEARRFDTAGHRIALVRVGDDFYAIGDRCSHANFSLSEGEVVADELELGRWKQGRSFSLVSGLRGPLRQAVAAKLEQGASEVST